MFSLTEYRNDIEMAPKSITKVIHWNILGRAADKWLLKADISSVWDKNDRLLAALDRCLLSRGSFTVEMHRGDQN